MKKTPYNLFLFFVLVNLTYSQYSILDSIKNKVSVDSLKKYVRQLSGDTICVIGGVTTTILSRNKAQPGNEIAAQYIYEKFSSFGITAQYQKFSTTGRNVVGTKNGQQFPNRYYVVCGHYDDMPTGTTAPGADDNASGTAAVVEIARVLSKYNFPFTIKYVAFDEEEQGLVGSNYFASGARSRNDSLLGVLNLDMIAYDGNNDGILNVHTKSISNTDEICSEFVKNISDYNINLTPVVVPSLPYSDHDSFLSKGFGAILVIEDDNDFHPNYHTTNDKFSKYNVPYYHKIVQATAITLAKFAFNYRVNIEHSPLVYTNLEEPQFANVVIHSGLPIGIGNSAPRLYYHVDYGNGFLPFRQLTPTDEPSNNLYNFIIPKQPLGSLVEYYIAVQDQNGTIVETLPRGGGGFFPPGSISPPYLFRFVVANINALFTDDFSTMNHWNLETSWGLTPNGLDVSPPTSITDSPIGFYSNDASTVLTLIDTVSLLQSLGAKLQYYARWDLETDYDYVQIQISSDFGVSWTPLNGKFTSSGKPPFQPVGQPLYNGTQISWVAEEIDLNSYVGKNIIFRFVLKSDHSITRDGFYLDDIKVLSYETESKLITTSINVVEGWNLISVPINSIDNSAMNLFPSAVSSLYSFQNTYTVKDTISVGKGYWVKFNNNETLYFAGNETNFVSIPVKKGWNIIGALNTDIPVSNLSTLPSGIFSSSLFSYNQGYFDANILQRGKGYWVKADEDGLVNVSISNVYSQHNSTLVKEENKSKLIFTDSKGYSTHLILKHSTNLFNYDDMPPLPPANAFDIRFAGDKFASDVKTEKLLLLQAVNFPLQIKLKCKEKISLEIYSDDLNSGQRYQISNDATLTIKTPINKLSIKEILSPGDFALYQNYPNPFNPSTEIKYQLPIASPVILKIYNILGQEVAVLVNEMQAPGFKSFKWDASNLPSGIYIYRLTAGKFTDVKKMTLIK